MSNPLGLSISLPNNQIRIYAETLECQRTPKRSKTILATATSILLVTPLLHV